MESEHQIRVEKGVHQHPHFLALMQAASRRAEPFGRVDQVSQPESAHDWSWASRVEQFHILCFSQLAPEDFDTWVVALYERLREVHDANALWIVEWAYGARWLPFIRLPTYSLSGAIERMFFLRSREGRPHFIQPAIFPAPPEPLPPILRVKHLLTGASVIC